MHKLLQKIKCGNFNHKIQFLAGKFENMTVEAKCAFYNSPFADFFGPHISFFSDVEDGGDDDDDGGDEDHHHHVRNW